jgi:predicted lipid-binding transport protein (Tim44 family)
MKSWIVLLFATAATVFARGGGGCFEEGTPVLTRTGPVPIERLHLGDEVIGGRVEAIYQVQPAEYLDVGVHVTPEHPFQIAPGIFRTAEKIFPAAKHLPAQRPAYNLLVSPGGTFIAGGFVVHNKGCFLPDTPILRADGERVAISDTRPGDKLLAFDADGHIVTGIVRDVLTHDVDEFLIVRTDRLELRVTVEHPFYVGDGTFKTLEALKPGDEIFAVASNQLLPQRILSIERVRERTRVYNLQTDAPNTFFANGIAVHNKGGGGFHGGGGYHGGYHSRGSGRPMTAGEQKVFLFLVGGVIGFIILVQIAAARRRQDENLDFVYSRKAIDGKADKTKRLLEFIARTDGNFAEEKLRQRATETFVQLQQCWQMRDYEPMRPLMMPDLLTQHLQQIAGLRRNHEINMIDQLHVDRVDIVNVRYAHQENQREFTALITATARDYYIHDQSREFLRGDDSPVQFQEFWTFQWQDGKWLLREIEQTRESDVLKDENFFEQFTDQGVAQVYGKEAGKTGEAGPWLEKGVETKANQIERLLNFLVQTDKLWDRPAMLERARQVFMDVYLGRESGTVKDGDLFPEVAASLHDEIARRRQTGTTLEFRNLCVRKVELLLVRNFADNTQDEFTVRISAHAQRFVKQGGAVVGEDECVTPFTEYWMFGRRDGQWKLKEVLPEAKGKGLVGKENVDEDSSQAQLQWYYRQTRAN